MQIWVTLLTIAGALGGTWLGTWLVGRQAAKDLRANITRDIEILGKLRLDSDEAKLLDGNIRKNVGGLVEQDESRRRRAQQDTSTTWLLGSLAVVSVGIGLMTSWRTHGFWEPLRFVIEGIYWGMWITYALLIVRVLPIAFSQTKAGVEVGRILVRVGLIRGYVGWLQGRIGLMKIQERWFRLRMLSVVRASEELLESSDAIAAWQEEHSGNEVSPEAREQFEELQAHFRKLSRKTSRRVRLLRPRSLRARVERQRALCESDEDGAPGP